MGDDTAMYQDVIDAPWYEKATDEEKQRLIVLMRRKSLKTDALADISAEIKTIRRRSIARMRRAMGKE